VGTKTSDEGTSKMDVSGTSSGRPKWNQTRPRPKWATMDLQKVGTSFTYGASQILKIDVRFEISVSYLGLVLNFIENGAFFWFCDQRCPIWV